MRIALIVSYYNRPDLLDLSLHSVSLQTRKPDQIILCDDGSEKRPFFCPPRFIYEHGALDTEAIEALLKPGAIIEVTNIRKFAPQPEPYMPDIYLRQPHNGFGKQRLLNKAILETDCDYLLVLDQDCVLSPGFISIHEKIAKRDQYVCAMYSSLTREQNSLVTKEAMNDGSLWQTIKTRYEGEPHIWCGAGSAVWKTDALRVNGFCTDFGWAGGDFNFGLRLAKLGLSWDHFCRYGRYLHLWHEKPWAEDKSDWRAGDRKTANDLARLWAEEGPVTKNGIAEQDMSEIELIRKDRG